MLQEATKKEETEGVEFERHSLNLSNSGDVKVERVDEVPTTDISEIVTDSVIKKIADEVDKEAPEPGSMTKVNKKKERKNKKSVDGIYIRRSCCFVFSL